MREIMQSVFFMPIFFLYETYVKERMWRHEGTGRQDINKMNSVKQEENVMTAKEYLQQLHKASVIIDQRVQEKTDLRARLSGIGSVDYSKERVQTGFPGGARYEREIIRIIDLENEIDCLLDEYVELKHKIIGQLHDLNNADQIKILYKRYVLYEKFEQIADDLNFSVRNVYKVHDRGLQEFQEIHLQK